MFDAAPPPKIWMPPKPALIRSVDELNRHDRRAIERQHGIKLANLGVTQLIGFGGGNVEATNITFVDSAVSNAPTITIPGSSQAGDLAVLIDFTINITSSNVTDVVPTGWTGLVTAADNSGSTRNRTRASYKVLVAGDPGSSVTGMNDSTENKVMLVFRAAASPAVTPAGWVCDNTQGGGTSSQSLLASGGNAPLVVIGASGIDAGTASFDTASPAFDATVATADDDLLVGYKIYNSAPADHTIFTDLGDTICGGWMEMA